MRSMLASCRPATAATKRSSISLDALLGDGDLVAAVGG
jgi:hypothetical protein